ncbi:hypothetical protein [Aureibacter tunicatorum]|uniref:Uncharacterized protein n=1 Tax=Aureibacter tunicatorum TaxID=866807 RepID=A0AAE3XGH0_9BACT|nr:hypothetical protein [Aureibacter tunicatorum]MDR6237171.1 hypothetical protein [Aureibacter tunicatorum]BDD06163.1 hypothetical protein AUTU_36460 [Aureibacter tunicatorum]
MLHRDILRKTKEPAIQKMARSSISISKNPPALTFANTPVVQAAFKPAHLKKSTHGYSLKNSQLTPLPSVELGAGRHVIIDDERYHTADEDDLWYFAYCRGVKEDFWVRESILEMEEPDHSFNQLMELFDECWDGKVTRRADFTRPYNTLQKNLYSRFTRNTIAKPPVDRSAQLDLARRIVNDLLVNRPTDRNLRLNLVDRKPHYYKHAELRGIRDYSHFPDYFMNMYGRQDTESERLKNEPVLETQSVPYKYDIYLNVKGPHVFQVTQDLMPLLDDPGVLGGLAVKSLSLAPFCNLSSRCDTFVLRIVNPDGFERVKVFLSRYIEEHQDYFVDECLRLTERFAPGASWSQDVWFQNVWGFDDRLISILMEYLDRVALQISDRKRNPPLFDFRAGQWSELERLHHKVQLQAIARPSEKDSVDESDLRKLSNLSMRLINDRPDQVMECLDHFEANKKKFGKDRFHSFFGLRSQILAELVQGKYRNRSEAFRGMMKIMKKYGVDIYHPYSNFEVKAYKDDSLVVVDTGFVEPAIVDGYEIASPEAQCFPILETHTEDSQMTIGDSITSTAGATGTDSEASILSSGMKKVYVQDFKGPTRQILKVLRKEKEDLTKGLNDQKLLGRELESQYEEL